MIDYGLLSDMGLIVSMATLLAFATKYLKQPPILAYMVAGIVMGPLGLSIITQRAETMALSELGIAFLLFGAAIDINLNKLRGVGIVSFVSCLLQVALTFAFSFIASVFLGLNGIESVYVGVILSFSSTMVIIKMLSDEKHLDTLHGRLLIGVLVLQDLLIITIMPVLRMLGTPLQLESVAITLFNGVGLFCLAVVVNKFVAPHILRYVSKSQELLFLTSITACFAFMGLVQMLGFSLAIGAFVAGIALSTPLYGPEISGRVRPLRDFFATIFFVTLGLQITAPLGLTEIGLGLALTGIAIIVKPVITMAIYLLLGYGGRVSLTVGLLLGQISEFSFIVASTGLILNHVSNRLFSVITLAILLSILLTPYAFKSTHPLFELIKILINKLHVGHIHFFHRRTPEKTLSKKMRGHVVIVGFDRMGQQLNEAVKDPLIVDYNPEIIDQCTEKGLQCIYGDAENEHVLENMELKYAKMIVSTIPDPEAVETLILRSRKENPHIILIVRASTLDEAQLYYKLGADLVILPEFIAGHKTAEIIQEVSFKKNKLTEMRQKHMELLEHAIVDRMGRRIRS
ncbi:MAG: cation:proton antiporter [Candidatus Diapherotrites archaeon]|nr:cation:proton antiporter [Candidatus Diapherotrites archaeon]